MYICCKQIFPLMHSLYIYIYFKIYEQMGLYDLHVYLIMITSPNQKKQNRIAVHSIYRLGLPKLIFNF